MSDSAFTLDDTDRMSAECVVALRPEYKAMHAKCRQTEDIPLPHSSGILLQARCHCTCHRPIAQALPSEG
ncbi:hypothetical protein ACOT81_19585 [Streptomyces sp. WI04-05B]|uniref:hypothetical protein n=1 Tax=Streptomyces TaxID=1883 RepID=UPI0029A21CEF|nr:MULTISPECIES: hypothetical protein [unclassified Streptomyces]MDX2542414.1 hypothetical protein [Streptomyces sp. WI04-05B]MDX2582567.1 hypothetical protein [Streptomyces sp. WI04-05A]MDX3747979.1 hypothetical protein [Streptomyces sp. AK08-02]